jgi:hypothetical protein
MGEGRLSERELRLAPRFTVILRQGGVSSFPEPLDSSSTLRNTGSPGRGRAMTVKFRSLLYFFEDDLFEQDLSGGWA